MKTKICKLSIVALLAGLVTISTGLSSSGNSGTDNLVKIDNFSFSPATLTIKAGTEVRWKNQDDIARIQGSEAARLLDQVKAEIASAPREP